MGIKKTTVEISEDLLREARELAARDGVTLRAVLERGLHRAIAEGQRSRSFRLRKASFRGKGLHPDAADAPWERLRDMAYEGRGG